MSDSELTLKATPPRMPRTVLERDRLMQFWSDVRERTALLVTAPAGFGKTTLLLQWRARWLDEGAIVAWFSVDDTDDPARFAAGLMHAAHQAGSPPNGGAEQAGRSGIEILTGLLADISLSERATVLMLDDAERLPEATLALVQYLLLNAPANLHVVIGSRAPLSLQTSDLLAQGNLAALTTEQLRFRLEESMAILERQLGARLTPDERARLHDATEGWPIGLQLAVTEIEHAPDPAGAIRSLSARHGSLQDYFNESLLKRIPADIVELLTRIAILENINAGLFALVTGHEVSEEALQRFMRETPILMVGEHREWARLHPLARDFFLSRFEQLPVAEQAELHARVSRWYRDHDDLHEAANHALAAGNEVLAQEYAARSLWALGTWGMFDEAREWVERIPPEMLARDMGLRLSAAMILALGERNAEALEIARAVIADPATTPELRVVALRVAAGAAGYSDLLGLVPQLVAQWPTLPNVDPIYMVSRANAGAFVALSSGQTREARDLVARALSGAPSDSLRLASAFGQMIVGMSHLWDGNPTLSVAALAPTLAKVEKTEGRRSVIACGYASVLAQALLQAGRPDAARALLANRLDILERYGYPDHVLLAYQTLAQNALRRGDVRRALAVLDGLEAISERRHLPRLRVHSLVERIRIHAFDRCSETVGDLLATLDALVATFDDGELLPWRPHVRLVALIAHTHAAIARGALDEADRTLGEAASLASSLSRGRDVRTVMALRAVVAHERGGARAQPLLREALHLARITGDSGFLAQVHPIAVDMAASFEDAAPRTRRVAVKRGSTGRRARRAAANALLTPKEVEVLQLMEQGLSNKRIARTLDVGGETVKWHLKNLFSKLSAVSRDHAIDRARLLGLVR